MAIAEFFSTILSFLINLIDLTFTATVGFFQLVGQVGNILNTFSMFEDFFSPIAWIGVMTIFGMVITAVVFRLITKLKG